MKPIITRQSFDELVQSMAEWKQLISLMLGENLETRDESGRSYLNYWACDGQTEIVGGLLKCGADITTRDNRGNTPLITASWWNHTEVVKLLINSGADIEARNNDQLTSLNCASQRAIMEPVKVLIARGANIYAQDSRGKASRDFPTVYQHPITQLQQQYEEFVTNRKPPKSAAEVYNLLAVYPLVDPKAPVDRETHLRQIFSHAKWEKKEQARSIMVELRDHGLDAAFCESLLALTEPASVSTMLVPHGRGR